MQNTGGTVKHCKYIGNKNSVYQIVYHCSQYATRPAPGGQGRN